MANSDKKNPNYNPNIIYYNDPDLEKFVNRLANNVERNAFIQETIDNIRHYLQVDRLVL